MEKYDNAPPAYNSINQRNIPLPSINTMINQINDLLEQLELSKTFQLNVQELENIAQLNFSFYNPDTINCIFKSKGKYKLQKSQLNSEKFVKIILLWFFNVFYKKWKDICDSSPKIKEIMIEFYTSISKIISKLYNEKFLELEHIEIITKFILILSVFLPSSKQNIMKLNTIIKADFFIDCSFTIIEYVFLDFPNRKGLMKEDEIHFFCNFLEFFQKKMINDNPENIFILTNENWKIFDFFSLGKYLTITESKEVENCIMNLLCTIYQFKFSKKSLSGLLSYLKECLVNFNQKPVEELEKNVKLLSFPLKYLGKQIEIERIFLTQNQFHLEKGFYFGKKKCGICVNSVQFEKGRKIFVFSFNLIPKNNVNEYTILSLVKQVKLDNCLSFSLVKNSISKNDVNNLSINNNVKGTKKSNLEKEKERANPELYKLVIRNHIDEKDLNIFIIPKKTYLFVIQIIPESITHVNITYSHYTNNGHASTETENIGIPLKFPFFQDPNNTVECFIGCTIQKDYAAPTISQDFEPGELISTFSGYLGSVIILTSQQNEEKVYLKEHKSSQKDTMTPLITFPQNILSLKGKYEQFLYFQEGNDMTNQLKYVYEGGVYPKIKGDFEDLQNSYLQKIKLYVSPNNYQLIEISNNYSKQDKNEYKFVKQNFLNIQPNKLFFKGQSSKINKNFNQKFHIFKNPLTLFEFLKFDGINYFSLHFEYYYQMLTILKQKQNPNNELTEKNEKIYNLMYIFIYLIHIEYQI